jgi:hypothetical protein
MVELNYSTKEIKKLLEDSDLKDLTTLCIIIQRNLRNYSIEEFREIFKLVTDRLTYLKVNRNGVMKEEAAMLAE